MSRFKQYIDKNVVEASQERIAQMYDLFDTVVCMFSGGKDSMVCVEMCRREAERRGQLPLDVIFLDEELLPNIVIDMVDDYRQRPWVNMRWYAVPMYNTKFVLGETETIVTWDPQRKWIREKPPFAITLPEGDDRIFRQQEIDAFAVDGYAGKVAFVLGIRTAESLTRYRSIVNKLNMSWASASKTSKRVQLCKPIYDWQEDDVMKWLHEEGFTWCALYDDQHLHGSPLRIATPLHGETAKDFGKWRRLDPDFYERLVEAFPEMQVQERYWKEYDRESKFTPYLADGFDGVERYIKDHITDPRTKRNCLRRLREFRIFTASGKPGYTPQHLLNHIVGGTVHRVILPQQGRSEKGH